MLLVDHLIKHHSFQEDDFGPGLILRMNSRNRVNVLETYGILRRWLHRCHYVSIRSIFRNGDQLKIRNGGELSRKALSSWIADGFVFDEFHEFSYSSTSHDQFHYGLIRNDSNYEFYAPVLTFCGEIEVKIDV